MANDMKKQAMSEAERQKYVKAAIVAAIGSAGIGALVRSLKAKSDRSKALDVDSSKNAIIVPIKKSKFVEELPTPEEFAASKKEQKTPSQPKLEQAPSFASMDPSDIAARKNEILRGRKVDFFGKRASVKAAQPEKKDGGDGPKKGDEVVSEEKIDGRVVLRGQDGKFVSPTDPVAVQQVEKDAGMGIWDTIMDPGKALGNAWDAAKERPVILTAGALGSIYLAAKISDAINESRRKHAKQRLDGARERYVELLEEDNEKKAFDMDVPETAGTVLGTAFIVPMALTALVTNKIISNRNAEKKKAKEMSDSYPDDPIVLYKTSEAKEVRISPDTAVAAIMFKAAMIDAADSGKPCSFIEKDAQSALETAKRTAVNWWRFINKGSEEIGDADASKMILDMMEDPKNSGYVLDMVKAREGNDQPGIQKAFMGMAGNSFDKLNPDPRFLQIKNTYENNPERQKKLMDSVLTSNRMQDLMVDRFTNDKYKDTFGAYKDELMAKRMGLKPGGMLANIISWFLNATGLGNHLVKSQMYDKFKGFRDQAAQNAAAAKKQVAGTAGAAPVATPPPAAQTAPVQNPAVVPSPVPQVNPPTGTATNNVVNVKAPA
jgi:hypothetical protein